jgi:hypothetical protein
MNKKQLTITANYIKKYGDKHFDITNWFTIDANYLVDNQRIKISDYSKVPLDEEEMPYWDVRDLNTSFENAIDQSESYKELTSGNLYESEEIYEQLCVIPFEALNESDIAKCNTTACVAGWAVLAYNDMTINNSFNQTIVSGFAEAGKDILELTEYETEHLFNCIKYSAWDLVAAKYQLEEKAFELAEKEYNRERLLNEDSWTWDELTENIKEGWYFRTLGSLITSTIAYEVLMDIVNNVIDISGIYSEYISQN